MIYDIRQVTRYAYTAPVPYARHVLRMMPMDRPGQRVIEAALSVQPQPAEWQEVDDFFGNRIVLVSLEEAHDSLVVELVATVDVEPGETLFAALTPPWEAASRAARQSQDLGPASPVHHLFASRVVGLDPQMTAYARESFAAGRPVLEAADDLMRRIKADFAYEPGVTDVSTPPLSAFEARKGVCQDFAHIMIAGLRGLGLPAAYVSGYLRTIPPPGKPRLEGADATHAWVSVWCGEAAGWIGLDPTNAVAAGRDHVVLAVGRDFADVSPMDGVIVSYGEQSLEVAVDVVPRRPIATIRT